VWEHETDIEAGIEAQLRHDGLEIMAVGTEAMQPDNTGIGFVHTGFDYQGIISHIESRSLQSPAL
jgi:hypothetical protein